VSDTTFSESHLLQRILPAGPDVLEPPLYERIDGDLLSFDTYFGVFHAARWRRKTSVQGLHVRVEVDGACDIEIVAVKRLKETVVATRRMNAAGAATFEVCRLADTSVDSYYVAIRGARLLSGGWYADNAPLRDVRLNAVITTFNRQPYVLANIDRMRRLGAEVPSLADHFRVTIVDNGRNLEVPAGGSLHYTVIPNPNLGGAGGFARGLIHARHDDWTTHVLFMDDDISMEVESLVRTIALFRYATDPQLCLHGAMISEEIPWMQFEAGAHYAWRYTYPLRAIGREDDLRDRINVLADEPEPGFEYTAWWFTAFPIGVGKDNPLPVFVRGDDVAFGLMHTGEHTITMKGVAVWHADFALKNGPMTLYYETRNMLLVETLVYDKHRWYHTAYRTLSFGFRNLFSLRYASLEYMLKGLDHYLEGPDFWRTVDHSAMHDEVRTCPEEKAGPLSPELGAMPVPPGIPKPIRLLGFIAAVPLVGGYILPKWILRKKTAVAPINSRAVGLATRSTSILHRHPRLDEGYVLERDAKRFWDDMSALRKSLMRLRREYPRLKREYRAYYAEMVSDEAWAERFGVSVSELTSSSAQSK
jgi:hypothetical protein